MPPDILEFEEPIGVLLKEIEALVPLGIIDGITTNPSLLAQEDSETDPRDHLSEIARSCPSGL